MSVRPFFLSLSAFGLKGCWCQLLLGFCEKFLLQILFLTLKGRSPNWAWSMAIRSCEKKVCVIFTHGMIFIYVMWSAKPKLEWKARVRFILEKRRGQLGVTSWIERHFSQPTHVYYVLRGECMSWEGLKCLSLGVIDQWVDSWCSQLPAVSVGEKTKGKLLLAKIFGYNPMIYYLSAKSLQLCLTLCNHKDCSLPDSSVHRNSPGKNTKVGWHALLQGIFPTQGSNLHLLHLLYWQAGSLPLVPLGKPQWCTNYLLGGGRSVALKRRKHGFFLQWELSLYKHRVAETYSEHVVVKTPWFPREWNHTQSSLSEEA